MGQKKQGSEAGIAVHSCNPSIWEREARRVSAISWAYSEPGLHKIWHFKIKTFLSNFHPFSVGKIYDLLLTKNVCKKRHMTP